MSTGLLIHRIEASHLSSDDLVFSPDGKLLYVGGFKGVLAYDTSNWKIANTILPESQGPLGIRRISLSKDGKTLVSNTANPEIPIIRVWDTTVGKELLTLQTQALSLILSESGNTLAAGQRDGTIQIWELPSGKSILSHRGHKDAIRSIALSQDGEMLATSSLDKSAAVWNTRNGKRLYHFEWETRDISVVVFSPDGKYLALGGSDEFVRIYDLGTGEEVVKMGGTIGPVTSARFTRDGRFLIVGSSTGGVHIWNVASGSTQLPRPGHDGSIRSMSLSSDGQFLASIDTSRVIRVWHTDSHKELKLLVDSEPPNVIRYSPDSKLLVSASGREIRFWNTTKGEMVGVLGWEGQYDTAVGLEFSPDGRWIATAGAQSIRIWDTANRVEALTLSKTEDLHHQVAVAFAPNGRLLAAASNSTVRIWDVASWTEQVRFTVITRAKAHSPRTGKRALVANVGTLVFSPDSSLLLGASHDGTVRVWEVSNGKEVFSFGPTGSPILSIALSPNGSILASSDEDSLIRLWEFRSGREIHLFEGHGGEVSSLTFLKEGKLLASGSKDSTILMWDSLDSSGERHPDVNGREDLWGLLASTDAKRAYGAMTIIASLKGEGVKLVSERLRPITTDIVQSLIERLDAESLEVRDQALASLSLVSGEAQGPLERALQRTSAIETTTRLKGLLDALKPPLISSPGRLRALRAIDALEWIGSREVQLLLERFVREMDASYESEYAKAALARIRSRKQ